MNDEELNAFNQMSDEKRKFKKKIEDKPIDIKKIKHEVELGIQRTII